MAISSSIPLVAYACLCVTLFSTTLGVTAMGCDSSEFEKGVDFLGGDIAPLGSGFRNASSAVDCCRLCLNTSTCAYFSFGGTRSGSNEPLPSSAAPDGKPGFPPHNCWLKSSFGQKGTNGDRTSGACGAPIPPNFPDACFPTQTKPWCDWTLPIRDRVASLVAAMTIAEKIIQVSTFTPDTVPGVSRIGLPPYSYHSEGLHGLRDSLDLNQTATIFPQTTGMAATGNFSMIWAMGQVMLSEARALNNLAAQTNYINSKGTGLFYWSPTMNLGRDPRWGRFQESISEDPLLNGAYASTFVQAFQGSATYGKADYGKYLGVAATCKHFVAYSLEASDGYDRHDFNAIVSARDMAESYLPSFKMCIVNGKPGQVMCSYNAVNGVPSCLHGDLMNGLLRRRWGYDGLIVSDQDAIETAFENLHYRPTQAEVSALGLKAGCDQNDGKTYADSLGSALTRGLLNESDVDVALTRILTQRFLVGSFDPKDENPFRSIPIDVMESPPHKQVSLNAAREAVVMLANNNNNNNNNNNMGDTSKPTLPLPKKAMNIAVVGPFATNPTAPYGGKPDYSSSFTITPFQGIQAAAKSMGATATFALGSQVTNRNQSDLHAAVDLAKHSDVTILSLGIDTTIEHEGSDRVTIGLPPCQEELLRMVIAASQGPVIVLLNNGGPLSSDFLAAASQGSNPSVHAILETFELGPYTGQVIAEILWGDVNPSGFLPFTVFKEDYVNQTSMLNMSMRAGPGRTYRFFKGTPLWPFGWSMSYTTFSLSWLKQPNRTNYTTSNPDLSADFAITVTNTGKVDGSKVVPVFISALGSYGNNTEDYPLRSLFDVKKVMLRAGESTTIMFSTKQWASYCTFCTVDDEGARALRPGMFTLQVGGDASSPLPHHNIVQTPLDDHGHHQLIGDTATLFTDVTLVGPVVPMPL